MPNDADRLAAANDIIIGAVENGPWMLIPDPQLRQLVGEYIADNCHSIASAAGLDEAMERAHDAMPVRLPRSLPELEHLRVEAAELRAWLQGPAPEVADDARERLARWLWAADTGDAQTWDDRNNVIDELRQTKPEIAALIEKQISKHLEHVDKILAVIGPGPRP